MRRRAPSMARSRGRLSRPTVRRGKTQKRRRSRAVVARRRSGARRTTRRLAGRMTTDHEEIRRWVEERGGHPATVKRTARGKQAAGIIRIDFPGFSGERSLQPISWDEWFDVFEQRQLAFLHQDRTANGKPSRFNKLVARE